MTWGILITWPGPKSKGQIMSLKWSDFLLCETHILLQDAHTINISTSSQPSRPFHRLTVGRTIPTLRLYHQNSIRNLKKILTTMLFCHERCKETNTKTLRGVSKAASELSHSLYQVQSKKTSVWVQQSLQRLWIRQQGHNLKSQALCYPHIIYTQSYIYIKTIMTSQQ